MLLTHGSQLQINQGLCLYILVSYCFHSMWGMHSHSTCAWLMVSPHFSTTCSSHHHLHVFAWCACWKSRFENLNTLLKSTFDYLSNELKITIWIKVLSEISIFKDRGDQTHYCVVLPCSLFNTQAESPIMQYSNWNTHVEKEFWVCSNILEPWTQILGGWSDGSGVTDTIWFSDHVISQTPVHW